MTNEEQARHWQLVQARCPAQDGRLFYGVLSTGIYCKPSCPARRPRREHVLFYQTQAEAERDGLRPCLRCRPQLAAGPSPAEQAIRAAATTLEANPGTAPPLGTLAAQAGMSPSHFQRTFTRLVGLSPKRYADALRLRTLKEALRRGTGVADSVYSSGFGSPSRVYEHTDSTLGMTPAQYGAGGRGLTITYATLPTPLGELMLGATERGLCFVQFADTAEALLTLLRHEYPQAQLVPMAEPAHPEFLLWAEAISRHLRGVEPSLALPVAVRATAFQRRVWDFLQRIPYGEQRSYTEVAEAIGSPRAVRAVASACAANPVALLIPCHRVLRSNGELGGYKWGIHRKRALLDLERKNKASKQPNF